MRSMIGFLGCLFLANLVAIDIPRPIKDIPSFQSGSGKYSLVAGNASFEFSFPQGWGVGETSTSQDKSSFSLFPNNGGFGCNIQVGRFASEMEASGEVSRLKASFPHVKDLSNGFEAVFPKAWYACYAEGVFVVQTWYSLPRKQPEHEAIWKQIKECLVVSAIKDPLEELAKEWKPVIEIPYKGWVCSHPQNKLHVLLKCSPLDKAVYNEDVSRAHLFAISDFHASGFFYLKWDQTELDKAEPYEQHLKEMSADILQMEKTQVFAQAPTGDLKQGWYFLEGSPYSLLTLSGDGFLFGFALKGKNKFIGYKLEDYIKRVSWWDDKE